MTACSTALSIDLRRRGEERSLEFVGVLGTAVRGLPSCRALDELRGSESTDMGTKRKQGRSRDDSRERWVGCGAN